MAPAEMAQKTTMTIGEMVRLATIPPAQLLAETRAALLLVDVQNRFIFGTDPKASAPTARVVEPIAGLLQTARAHNVPRYYVTVGHAPGYSDSAPWMRRLNDMGSDIKGRLQQPPLPPQASEIPRDIAPLPGEIHLTKWRFSAFYETALDVLLRGAAIETVVIGGVASYGCIIATYVDACSRGFFPLLCADAIDGTEPIMHRAAMDFMGPSALGVETIIDTWSARS
jgi:nicotinamidase-related amidase